MLFKIARYFIRQLLLLQLLSLTIIRNIERKVRKTNILLKYPAGELKTPLF